MSAAILWSQHRIQKQQLLLAKYNADRRWKLALYDKRYPVFLTTMEFISAVLRDANVTKADLFSFLRNTKDKDLLFGEEVREHIEIIHKRAVHLNCIVEMLESEHNMDKRAEMADAMKCDLGWFTKQFDTTKDVFRKYIHFSEDQ